MKRSDIQIRDPFVLPDPTSRTYYLYGTTDKNPWNQPGQGFEAYASRDLETWDGPFVVFRPPSGFWGTHDFWAPEVHAYSGAFYMFATFIGSGRMRGTQIFRAASPLGPFLPVSDTAATPGDWMCLDGTLFVDDDSEPWIVFCHEWVQCNDGEVCAQRLSRDLSAPIGEPRLLFRASAASWPKLLPRRDGSGLVDARVTDGPFVFRATDGTLLMLWSSLAEDGYAMGWARSTSGGILGPWEQGPKPLIQTDGGHGMVFRDFAGRLFVTYHSPNKTPLERFCYRGLEEVPGGIRLSGAGA